MSKSTHQLWNEYTARSRDVQINGWREFQDALIRARQESDHYTSHARPVDQTSRGMSSKVQQFLERVENCERIASQTKDRDAKASFVEVARQWRELARQQEGIEKNLKASRPPGCEPGGVSVRTERSDSW